VVVVRRCDGGCGGGGWKTEEDNGGEEDSGGREKLREGREDERRRWGCWDFTKLPSVLWLKWLNCPWCCICVKYFGFTYHFCFFMNKEWIFLVLTTKVIPSSTRTMVAQWYCISILLHDTKL
jgi:hypothetical protein